MPMPVAVRIVEVGPRDGLQNEKADIGTAALASGMTLMRDDGERLVRSGITSREERLRVTRD